VEPVPQKNNKSDDEDEESVKSSELYAKQGD